VVRNRAHKIKEKTTMMSKGYSSRSNAKRAAVAQFPEGNFELVVVDGKHHYKGLEIEITAQGEQFVRPEITVVTDSPSLYLQEIGRAHRPEGWPFPQTAPANTQPAPIELESDTVVEEEPELKPMANVFGAMMAQLNGEAPKASAAPVANNGRVHKLDDTHSGCPLCGAGDADVAGVEPDQDAEDPRRHCNSCGERFNMLTGQRIRAGYKVENAARGHKIQKGLPEQNGVKKRSEGTLCAQVWDLCDTMRAETGDIPTSKDMRRIAPEKGWNLNNVLIEYYQWRKFHGITSVKK
jgi:hypothetical protein